jgi:nucleoside-diphosphate-sugar epimerase
MDGKNNSINVFIAGGSGAIGVPLTRALVRAGHQVTALTRSTSKQAELRALGATPAVADALNRDALIAAVESAHPTHVIHQLTALPKGGPRRPADLDATNRLRIDGTRNLLDAAINAGARRFLAGSFALLSARDSRVTPINDEAAAAVQSMESQVLEATRRGSIEGIVLRYGMFYGLETASTIAMIDLVRKRRLPVVRGDAGQLPFIYIGDAVSATIAALDRAPAGSSYDIVDDRAVSMADVVEALAEYTGSAAPFRVPAWLPRLVAPYMARVLSIRMPLSNAKAKADLGWRPTYSTMRDGLAGMFRRAA